MNEFNEEDYFSGVQEYVDPILVSYQVNGSSEKKQFKCMDYEFDGVFWKFVSLPPQRGRRIIRIISPSVITYMEILEPEDRPVVNTPAIAPTRVISSGPQTYDAKGPDAIAEHRLKRSMAKPAHDERSIPMSVTVNDVDGETLVHAAMVKA